MANRKILELCNGDLVIVSKADAIKQTDYRSWEQRKTSIYRDNYAVYTVFGSGEIIVFSSNEQEDCKVFLNLLEKWLTPAGPARISVKMLMRDHYENKAKELEEKADKLREEADKIRGNES